MNFHLLNVFKKQNLVIDKNLLGEVKVSMSVIESLVNKEVTRLVPIKKIKINASLQSERVIIVVKFIITTLTELSILRNYLPGQIQTKIKDLIMNFTGEEPGDVQIILENKILSKYNRRTLRY